MFLLSNPSPSWTLFFVFLVDNKWYELDHDLMLEEEDVYGLE